MGHEVMNVVLIVIVIISSSGLFAGWLPSRGVDRANLYFDELLMNEATQEVRKLELDPLPVPPFAVNLSGLTEGLSDFHVEFKEGKMTGLAGGVYRFEEATAPMYVQGNITVLQSQIRFIEVEISSPGQPSGRVQPIRNYKLKADVLLMDTTALVEVTVAPSETPKLNVFKLNRPVNLTMITPQGLPLTDTEMFLYKKEIVRELKRFAEGAILTKYGEALRLAIARKAVPRPVKEK